MAIRDPRKPRKLSCDAASKSSRPSPGTKNSATPSVFACGGSNPINASEVTDFPDPDSPTNPSTSPGAMEKLTSRTAINGASDEPIRPAAGNFTVKLRTSSSATVTAQWYQPKCSAGASPANFQAN